MTSQEQEELWAAQLRECRIRFIARVREASSLTSPTRRRALYEQWRSDLGDISARESAKFAEAIVAGRRKLYELERMVEP